MFDRLRQPFPDSADFRQSLLTIFYVGVFVGLFLFFIRPFGIEGSWANLATASAGFGAVTIVFGWIFEFVSRYLLKVNTEGPTWTLGKWIIFSTILVVWIAFGNYLFINWLSGWSALGYFNLLRIIGYTSLIGIFPVALSGIVIQMRATNKNEKSANDISMHLHEGNDNDVVVMLEAESGKSFPVNVAKVRFVEAMQNYVSIHFLNDDQLKKEVIRTTIGSIEETFKNSAVVRCHRSYLVNLNHIEKVSGNAQGLRLKLDGINEPLVPVSRSYISKVRKLLN